MGQSWFYNKHDNLCKILRILRRNRWPTLLRITMNDCLCTLGSKSCWLLHLKTVCVDTISMTISLEAKKYCNFGLVDYDVTALKTLTAFHYQRKKMSPNGFSTFSDTSSTEFQDELRVARYSTDGPTMMAWNSGANGKSRTPSLASVAYLL